MLNYYFHEVIVSVSCNLQVQLGCTMANGTVDQIACVKRVLNTMDVN